MPLDPLRFSDPIVKVYEACVDELLVSLAKHFNVSAMGNTGSFEYEVMMLSKLGAVRRETARIIAKHVAENEPMIEEAVRAAMLDALEEVEPELRKAAEDGLLHDAPMDVNDGIQERLTAYSRQARNQLNLVNASMVEGTASTFRTGVYKALETLNIETGKVIAGVSPLQKAVRDAVRAMADNGITGFTDRKGRKWTAEAYVRMVAKTTCSNAANAAVQARNEQYGNDIVWPRTNATARPGCYPWQGKLISLENRARDVLDGAGNTRHVYAANETTYGQPDGIWGINCHHGPMNVFIPGFSYVRGEDVKPDKAENDRLYALTQEQRRLERQVRYAKRDAAMYDAAGDKVAFEQAAIKVKESTARLKNFVKSHDSLVFSGDKVYTFGYTRSVSSKVNWSAKRHLDKEHAAPASGRFLLHTDRLYVNSAKIKPIDGVDDFVIHGDKIGFELRDHQGNPYKNLSVKKFVEMVKESPVYKGGPIRLISCEAGADGSIVAQAVSDLLGVQVIAPSDIVWVHPDGSMTIGSDAMNNTGEWRIFNPKGV